MTHVTYVVNTCPACGARSWRYFVVMDRATPGRHCRTSSWCGKCYANIKGRSNYRGHANYRQPRKGSDSLALMKPAAGSLRGSASPPVSLQSTYLSAHLALLEFLSCQSWEDGSLRVPGTLQLTVTEGRWSGKLKDPHRKGYAYLSGATIDELLEAIEAALGTDQVAWREDRPFNGPRK